MNLHRLDLVSLALFNLVARSGSISRGAALAHLAVGAASKRVTDLETAVGAPLLERHSRGVTLTAAGQALQRHAQRILADVDQLEADLSDHASGMVGRVRLAAITSAVTQFLPADLASFVAEHPGIGLEMEETNSREAVLAVADGRADLAVFAERTATLGLQTAPYRTDRLALVVPPGHPLARPARRGARAPVALAEVVEHDMVSLSPDTSLAQRLTAETAAIGRRLRVRVHVRSFDAMCQMVAAGLGIAVLPEQAVQAQVRALGLVCRPLAGDWVARELLLGVRDGAALPRPVRLLHEHLLAGRTAAR